MAVSPDLQARLQNSEFRGRRLNRRSGVSESTSTGNVKPSNRAGSRFRRAALAIGFSFPSLDQTTSKCKATLRRSVFVSSTFCRATVILLSVKHESDGDAVSFQYLSNWHDACILKGESAGERWPNLRSDSDGNYIRQSPRDLQGVESGHEVAFSDGVRHQSNSLDESLTARTVPGPSRPNCSASSRSVSPRLSAQMKSRSSGARSKSGRGQSGSGTTG